MSTTTGTLTVAQIRGLRDQIRDATTRTLTEAQRAALVEVLDEIGVGIAVVARVRQDYPDESGTYWSTKVHCWQRVAAAYTTLLAAGTTP